MIGINNTDSDEKDKLCDGNDTMRNIGVSKSE